MEYGLYDHDASSSPKRAAWVIHSEDDLPAQQSSESSDSGNEEASDSVSRESEDSPPPTVSKTPAKRKVRLSAKSVEIPHKNRKLAPSKATPMKSALRKPSSSMAPASQTAATMPSASPARQAAARFSSTSSKSHAAVGPSNPTPASQASASVSSSRLSPEPVTRGPRRSTRKSVPADPVASPIPASSPVTPQPRRSKRGRPSTAAPVPVSTPASTPMRASDVDVRKLDDIVLRKVREREETTARQKAAKAGRESGVVLNPAQVTQDSDSEAAAQAATPAPAVRRLGAELATPLRMVGGDEVDSEAEQAGNEAEMQSDAGEAPSEVSEASQGEAESEDADMAEIEKETPTEIPIGESQQEAFNSVLGPYTPMAAKRKSPRNPKSRPARSSLPTAARVSDSAPASSPAQESAPDEPKREIVSLGVAYVTRRVEPVPSPLTPEAFRARPPTRLSLETRGSALAAAAGPTTPVSATHPHIRGNRLAQLKSPTRPEPALSDDDEGRPRSPRLAPHPPRQALDRMKEELERLRRELDKKREENGQLRSERDRLVVSSKAVWPANHQAEKATLRAELESTGLLLRKCAASLEEHLAD